MHALTPLHVEIHPPYTIPKVIHPTPFSRPVVTIATPSLMGLQLIEQCVGRVDQPVVRCGRVANVAPLQREPGNDLQFFVAEYLNLVNCHLERRVSILFSAKMQCFKARP